MAITKINKNNKLAGILLIVSGILALIPNIISSILWLIAGIMLLVRKSIPNYRSNDSVKHRNEQVITDDNRINSNDPFEEKAQTIMRSLN